MRQVLIIVHLPRASPRIEGLVKHLPEFNWQPIILTGVTNSYKNLPSRIVETPYRNALGSLGHLLRIDTQEDNVRQKIANRFGMASKKHPLDFLLTLAGEIINYPCPDKNWKPFAVQVGSKLLQEENIDAVISSSPPIISNLIAREFKDRYKILWLADFRDLWAQSHSSNYGRLRKLFDKRLELKTLAEADALITTSEPWAEKLSALHQRKPVYTITHGFDPDELNKPPTELTLKFTITYAGSIYPGKQNPWKLFAALRDLISNGTMNTDEIDVRFYGAELGWLDKEIERYGLSGVVKQYGMIPQYAAIEKQRESQLLLLLDWDDPREKGVYTGKIFEYFGARRPILATGGVAGNVVDVLLGETKAGIHAATVADIKGALIEFYEEYKLTGRIADKGLETEINRYTHREMASKFADILDRLTSK